MITINRTGKYTGFNKIPVSSFDRVECSSRKLCFLWPKLLIKHNTRNSNVIKSFFQAAGVDVDG